MLSGDCMPIKSAEFAHSFLDREEVDYIESFDYFNSDWIKTGIKEIGKDVIGPLYHSRKMIPKKDELLSQKATAERALVYRAAGIARQHEIRHVEIGRAHV